MKIEVEVVKQIEVDAIRMELPVRYEEEDMPNDFPFRQGEMWRITVDLATGKIRDWPAGRTHDLCMKVVDGGCYYLMSGDKVVSKIEGNYVPRCVPGSYGDYVEFKIAEDGTIANWSRFATEERVVESFEMHGDGITV